MSNTHETQSEMTKQDTLPPPDGVSELVKDIHNAIAELAGISRYPDLTEAIDRLAALAAQAPQTEAANRFQALTDPENQPNQFGLEFQMVGPKLAFSIGNQTFILDYEPDGDEEVEFMKRMLCHALSVFTPDVKAPQQAQGVPASVPRIATPEMRARFREAYREGGFWSDRLDYALDQMLAAAPQAAPAQAQAAPVAKLTVGTDGTLRMHAFKWSDCPAIFDLPNGEYALVVQGPATDASTHQIESDHVTLIGVKADGTEHVLGSATMPARMKARDLVRDMFNTIDEEAGDAGAMAFWACEQLIDWMENTHFEVKLSDSRQSAVAAINTLRAQGFTFHGGEQWKPPLGLPADATHGQILRVIARRARCFPMFPMGYHMPEVFRAIGEAPPQPGNEGEAAPPQFSTSKAGRDQVALFFAEHLKRHDFTRYISDTLAADFACALAPVLYSVQAAALQAEHAGQQAAAGHLSTLVDEAQLILSELHQYAIELQEHNLGGRSERGEVRIMDVAEDWLGARPELANSCTCPSGDGSLRWPCPAHPQGVAAVWVPTVLFGPRTSVCWTPDHMPKDQRVSVVLISESDYLRACHLLAAAPQAAPAPAPQALTPPTDEQIAAAVRPLYRSDQAAKLGLDDDIRTVRAVFGIGAASAGGEG